MPTPASLVEELLRAADVRINGDRPWDIHVNDERFFARVIADGSLGLGESYMDGWWDAERVDECIYHILRADLPRKVSGSWRLLSQAIAVRLVNRQSAGRAFHIADAHYNLGNDLYRAMLDPWLQYSCGYWETGAKTLEEAQAAKLDLICRKLKLEQGMRLLDVGCGWGGLAKYAAERYGVRVVGVTVSKEQATLATEWCAGLPVEIRLQDYRELRETFDRVVSVGMFEHVGPKNYRTYMRVVHRCLDPQGIFLLHSIGGPTSVHRSDPWIDKYIFPNAVLPSVAQISRAAEGSFILEDWHNFGHSYDPTLLAWERNFRERWPMLQAQYDGRFYRMWRFYLLSCAALFRARYTYLWQIALTKRERTEHYAPVR
jgi:cyclopropane-fatty-acyl-phospholipid synthase